MIVRGDDDEYWLYGSSVKVCGCVCAPQCCCWPSFTPSHMHLLPWWDRTSVTHTTLLLFLIYRDVVYLSSTSPTCIYICSSAFSLTVTFLCPFPLSVHPHKINLFTPKYFSPSLNCLRWHRSEKASSYDPTCSLSGSSRWSSGIITLDHDPNSLYTITGHHLHTVYYWCGVLFALLCVYYWSSLHGYSNSP